MVSAILAGLVAGVLYTVGYRLNTSDGSIVQGGLLQVASTPSGARVSVDNRQLSGSTPMRVDAQAGSHSLKITRDGYRSWQKTVSIQAGTVHWASYARLVPVSPAEQVQHSFESLSAVLPAVERDLILTQISANSNIFQLIDVGSDQPGITSLELPHDLAVAPSPTDAEPTYRMMQWDESDRLVLLEYQYPDYRGWIVFDTRSPQDSVNVSELLDSSESVKSIMFDERNGRALYVLTNGIIRRLDTSSRTLSAPLARNVTDMRQSHDGIVTFATARDSEGYRTVGYYTRGASQSRTLQRFEAADSETVSLVLGEYQGKQYAAVQRDLLVEVYRLSLHSSDSKSSINLARIATITGSKQLSALSFSPHDRFVFVQHGDTYTVYDIELDRTTTTAIQGSAPVDRALSWLDRYHLWSDRDGDFRWYEFDGENAQSITAVVPGFMPKLTDNERYLYVIQAAPEEAEGYVLVRVGLRA